MTWRVDTARLHLTADLLARKARYVDRAAERSDGWVDWTEAADVALLAVDVLTLCGVDVALGDLPTLREALERGDVDAVRVIVSVAPSGIVPGGES